MLLTQDAQPPVADCSQYLRCVVRRAVVDDEELEVAKRLPQYAFERLAEEPHSVAHRQEQHEQVTAPARDEESAGCCQRGKDQPFDEKLLQQASPPGAHRHADSDFMPSRKRPDKQEVADVGAGDQKHKNYNNEHGFERGEQVSRVIERRLP